MLHYKKIYRSVLSFETNWFSLLETWTYLPFNQLLPYSAESDLYMTHAQYSSNITFLF